MKNCFYFHGFLWESRKQQIYWMFILYEFASSKKESLVTKITFFDSYQNQCAVHTEKTLKKNYIIWTVIGSK